MIMVGAITDMNEEKVETGAFVNNSAGLITAVEHHAMKNEEDVPDISDFQDRIHI